MIAGPCTPNTDLWIATCSACIALVPCALAGLAFINAGFTRTRSVAHTLFTSLGSLSASAAAFLVVSLVWHSSACARADDAESLLHALFGMFAAGMAVLIAIGAAAERLRLAGALCSAVFMGGVLLPLYLHWSAPGGWLAQLGAIDNGGSGLIHALGGMNALTVAWVIGPRKGKFSAAGMPSATPGHSAPYILFGCLLTLAGWSGINAAGSLLLGAASLRAIPGGLVTTVAGAVSGFIGAALLTRIRFGKPDASLGANGWVAGLVATSAGCGRLNPAAALLIGFMAGLAVVSTIEIFEMRLKIDDPSGAISVHAVAGLWGLLATGLFLGPAQIVAQLCAIGMLLGALFPMSYAGNFLINRFFPYRVSPEGERQGMDLCELGAGAYPEFMIHRDDLFLR